MPVPMTCASASRSSEGRPGDDALGEAFGDDIGDRLSDQLVARIAELLLGLKVEQDDQAGLVNDHHGVWSRLEQAAIFRR